MLYQEHDKVITSLRTAPASEVTFDKKQTSHDIIKFFEAKFEMI
jgi:hypothetical protein